MSIALRSAKRSAYRLLRVFSTQPSGHAAIARDTVAGKGTDPLSQKQRIAVESTTSKDNIPPPNAGQDERQAGAEESREESKDAVDAPLEERLTDAALRRVPEYGWSDDSIAAGAEDIGISAAAIGIIEDGPFGLVGKFIDRCNRRMARTLRDEKWVKRNGLENAEALTRVKAAIKLRLEMNEEYRSTWRQALALQSLPQNAPKAMERTAKVVDEIWHFAGDTSVNFDWYTKRAALATIFHSTELFWLTDNTEGRTQTWRFLDKALVDVLNLGRGIGAAARQASQTADILLKTMSSALPLR